MRRIGRIVLALAVATVFLPAAAPGARAGDDAAPPAHLDFRHTYAQALLESRVRNVPVLVMRLKDD